MRKEMERVREKDMKRNGRNGSWSKTKLADFFASKFELKKQIKELGQRQASNRGYKEPIL
jgi:hypothetical protein